MLLTQLEMRYLSGPQSPALARPNHAPVTAEITNVGQVDIPSYRPLVLDAIQTVPVGEIAPMVSLVDGTEMGSRPSLGSV